MNVTHLLDPQLADAVATWAPFDLGESTLELLRATSDLTPLSNRVDRREVVVPGDPQVTIRVHRPVGIEGTLPCIVSLHGGSYVLGDATRQDHLFDRWCPELSVVGVAVEYRRPPESPYPAPLTDCYTALKWVHDHADELGIDPLRIGVHGRGAGAGLAAALAAVARDHREVPLRFQVLESPMLDDRLETISSAEDLPGWSRTAAEFGWRSYLADLHGADDLPLYAAVGRGGRLRRLPEAFVSVGALDGFLDETVAYATELNHAGVAAELHVYPGAPHGFEDVADSDVARRAERDKLDWLRQRLVEAALPYPPVADSRPTDTASQHTEGTTA